MYPAAALPHSTIEYNGVQRQPLLCCTLLGRDRSALAGYWIAIRVLQVERHHYAVTGVQRVVGQAQSHTVSTIESHPEYGHRFIIHRHAVT